METPVLQVKALQVTEEVINDDVTLVYMPDLQLCDFQLRAGRRYLVHFLNSNVFGMEFAILHGGNNVLELKTTGEQTESFFFDDAQTRKVLHGVEGQRPGISEQLKRLFATPIATVTPCTGPIIIPPRGA